MEILSPLIIIFFLVSTIVLCLTCFYLLEREYAKRRLLHLRFFAQSQFWEGLALLSFFSGQALTLFGRGDIGQYFIDSVQGVSINIAGAATTLGVLAFMKPGRVRSALFALVAVPLLLCSAVVVTTPPTTFFLDGFPVSGLTFVELFTNLGPLVIEWLLLIGVGLAVVFGRLFLKKPKVPHLEAISYAGLLGFLLITIYIGVVTGLLVPQLLVVSGLLVPLLMGSLFVGAVSYRHENPVIAARPWKIFTSSIFVKFGISNAAIFLLGGFVLIGALSSFYDGTVRATRDEAMQNLIEFTVSAQDTTERESLALVRAIGVRIGAERLNEDPDPIKIEVIRRTVAQAAAHIPGASFVAIVHTDGVITDLFGQAGSVDLAAHPAVAAALAGQAGSDFIVSADGTIIETISASPIFIDGATDLAIVCMTRVPASGTATATRSTHITQGMLAADGGSIIGLDGDPSSMDLLLAAVRNVVSGRITKLDVPSFGTVFARRTVYSGATFFAFVPIGVSQQATLAVIFAAVALAMVISALMMAFELFSVGSILSPITLLVSAARRMEKDDLKARVQYTSFDEVGTLASAFNSMASTIEERTARLNELLRQQKGFLTNAAEDLQTPLNHFRWGLETMRFGEAGKLTLEQMDLAEQMNITSLHLEETLQNIIDTEKLSDGRVTIQPVSIDLLAVIQDVAGQHAVRMHKKRIEFIWNPPASLPLVIADGMYLRRVIGNLVDNAVKYTDPGGKVTISAKAGRDVVTVAVADTGRGVPPKDKPFMFSKFFRASNVARQDIEGTGLGLYICKKLIALHGGRIWFVSDLGKGSTFSFTVVAVGTDRAPTSS